jgi:hypothetical protein
LWEADLNRPARGAYNPVDCFMLDELVSAAERNDVHLMLCLLARDLYMGALDDEAGRDYGDAVRDATKLLRYASARWGYSTSVLAWEYWNEMDPGKPTARFYREAGDHLAGADPYRHLRTTSAWASAPADWEHPSIDIAQEHYYLRPSERGRVADEVAAVVERAALVRKHAPAKPALLGEFGLATDTWGLSESMKRDTGLVHFHNALWASALSGLSGTAMFWWWEQLDQMDAYRHYAPLARFVADIPFTSARLRPAGVELSLPGVRAVGLRGDACAYVWLVNEAATWTHVEVDGPPREDISGLTATVDGLAPGDYRLEWWDPRSGEATARETQRVTGGTATVRAPGFRWDVACKLVREP